MGEARHGRQSGRLHRRAPRPAGEGIDRSGCHPRLAEPRARPASGWQTADRGRAPDASRFLLAPRPGHPLHRVQREVGLDPTGRDVQDTSGRATTAARRLLAQDSARSQQGPHLVGARVGSRAVRRHPDRIVRQSRRLRSVRSPCHAERPATPARPDRPAPRRTAPGPGQSHEGHEATGCERERDASEQLVLPGPSHQTGLAGEADSQDGSAKGGQGATTDHRAFRHRDPSGTPLVEADARRRFRPEQGADAPHCGGAGRAPRTSWTN